MRQVALGTTPANIVNAFGGGALDLVDHIAVKQVGLV